MSIVVRKCSDSLKELNELRFVKDIWHKRKKKRKESDEKFSFKYVKYMFLKLPYKPISERSTLFI